MTEKITAVYLDEEVEISTKYLRAIEFQLRGKKYRIKLDQDGKEFQVSADGRLAIYPRAANMIWVRIED